MKDTNNQAIFRNLGASNHAKEDRQTEDYYATEPKAAELLLGVMPELRILYNTIHMVLIIPLSKYII